MVCCNERKSHAILWKMCKHLLMSRQKYIFRVFLYKWFLLYSCRVPGCFVKALCMNDSLWGKDMILGCSSQLSYSVIQLTELFIGITEIPIIDLWIPLQMCKISGSHRLFELFHRLFRLFQERLDVKNILIETCGLHCNNKDLCLHYSNTTPSTSISASLHRSQSHLHHSKPFSCPW